MTLSLWFIHLAARLARQLMKKGGIICMHMKSRVHIFSGNKSTISEHLNLN